MKEFCLSSKILTNPFLGACCKIKDIEEFIKLLKKELLARDNLQEATNTNIINKLAGGGFDMKDFCLSSKMMKNIIERASTSEKNKAMWLDRKKTEDSINKDIREFIRLLKEALFDKEHPLSLAPAHKDYVDDVIKDIAGEGLI